MCGDGALVIRFFGRVIQQCRFLDAKKIKPTSTTATSGAAPSALRSALDSSIQAYAQTQSGSEETCRGASDGIFFHQSIRAQHDELLLCVYSA